MRNNTRTYLLLLFAIFSQDITGQGLPDLDFMEYRYVGPTRGGRVTAVEGVRSEPNVFYMGATGGGVWRTEDYGTTWENISDGFFESPSIGAISVAQNDPNVIYVGTGSDGLRSNVIVGKGMYKSINAGTTWTSIGLKDAGLIGAVEINPTDNNTVFVAAIGQPFQANSERGVFRTKDGGQKWEKVLYLSDTTGFVDIEFMPTNPNIIYAAAWRAERKPWTVISGGKENGIYKSIDGGGKWEKTGKGLPSLMGKIDLAVSPADSKLLYALVEAPGKETGLYISDDQGETFNHISDNKDLLNRAFYYTNLEVDPINPDILYSMAGKFLKSTDRGETWTTMKTPHVDSHDIWINPDDPKLIIQSNDGGANVTHNGGISWSHQFNQPTGELYTVEVDNQYPYWLYSGQQDNYTTIAVPSLPPSNHQAGATGFIMDTGGCETGPAVPDPEDPNIVYVNCKGKFGVYNKTTGQQQNYFVGAQFIYGHNPKDLNLRFQRVAPIHISPHDSKVIYHCSQYVHKTTDKGKTWETISPDLTAFEPDKQVISGSPITRDITGEEFYSTIYSIRESKIEKGVIWVGSNDGPIHVTQDAGKNWNDVSPRQLMKGGRVDCVEPSSHTKGKAYVSVLRYQLGDWKPYIFKTENYGKNWTLLTKNKGIPMDYPVRVVREDPDVAGLLYAGTEYGMFISFDDGESWRKFQQNLPVTPITDIKVHRKDLAISTMGRGLWILNDLQTLHQSFDGFDKQKVQLFNPEDGIRYRYNNISSTGKIAKSPPYPRPGIFIDYYLPNEVKVGIELQILNAENEIIRSISSNDSIETRKAVRNMSTDIVSYTVDSKLKSEAGMYRYRWDFRHTGAWQKEEKKRYKGGVVAAPGIYKARLIVNEEVLEQDFEIKIDPRVAKIGVSVKDLKAQEKLSLEIQDLLSETRKRANEITKAITKIKDTNPEELKRLKDLEAQLVQKKGAYRQPMLISQINYLLGMLKGRDQLPGRDAYERLEQLQLEFSKIKEIGI